MGIWRGLHGGGWVDRSDGERADLRRDELASSSVRVRVPVRVSTSVLAVCHILKTGNESHRFLHSSKEAKKRIKAREQARRSDKAQPSEEPF